MVRDLLYRFRALFHRNVVESELDEELRFHFDEQVEKYVRSGLSRKEAVRRSLAKLGNDAMPVDIQKDVKERFGIDLTTAHISTTKGLLRKAAGGQPAMKKPESAATPPAGPRRRTPRATQWPGS